MLEKLKTLNLDRMDLDEAVALVTIGRATEAGYAHYSVSAPQWLTDALGSLDGEIKRRRRDMLEARRKEIQANLTQLKTREEKKDELAAELKKLDAALG